MTNAPENLQIEVQCYGVLQQICGGRSRSVPVPALPTTVSHVLERLAEDVPELRAYLGSTACALGDQFVQRNAPVRTGDTLVLLPPVSGG